MKRVLILAVGQDPMILSSRCSILRSAGHIVVSAFSIASSFDLFRSVDFDVVILCHSISEEDRDRLTSAIRASGSHIPIYTVAALATETPPGITDGLLSSSPESLIEEVERAARRPAEILNNVGQV